jgi:hypothetical protein
MTFYVEKKLALGSISFGVSHNRSGGVDADTTLSTGAEGEFIRQRSEGFFFGGQDRFAGPTLPTTKSISSTPFWSSLKPDGTRRGYGFLALLVFGAIFVLLGFAVVASKGPQGWVEIILGAIMIGVPIALTAQKRKQIREQEELDRAEREALEKRNREMLAAYIAALERARSERSDEAFAQLERERQALTLPYQIWGALARRTVLLIGFDELAKRGPAASNELATLMDRFSRAAGLTGDDQAGVKVDLYCTILWHLLADDRLGPALQQQLALIRKGLGISDDEGKSTTQQFQRVQGLSAQTPPRVKCSTQLAFQEYCIYETPTDRGTLHVTNKRLILEGKKRLEMPVTHAFDVVVNADESVIIAKTDNPKKPLRLRVEQAVYTAAMLDLAASLDERPRGFA